MIRFTILSAIVLVTGCATTPFAPTQVQQFSICKVNPNATFINKEGVKVLCSNEMTIRKTVR